MQLRKGPPKGSTMGPQKGPQMWGPWRTASGGPWLGPRLGRVSPGGVPRASVIRGGISRQCLGRCTRAEVPGRRSPGWGVPGEEAKVLDCLPLASVWRSI